MSSVDKKIASFATKPTNPEKPGIVLPKAFAVLTKRAFGIIPDGARVCAEQSIQGKFYLSWYDDDKSEHNATATRDDIDIEPVYEAARATLLKDISTEDLHREIRCRETDKQKTEVAQ